MRECGVDEGSCVGDPVFVKKSGSGCGSRWVARWEEEAWGCWEGVFMPKHSLGLRKEWMVLYLNNWIVIQDEQWLVDL